jgi:chaperonin cofactor prefoldin
METTNETIETLTKRIEALEKKESDLRDRFKRHLQSAVDADDRAQKAFAEINKQLDEIEIRVI